MRAGPLYMKSASVSVRAGAQQFNLQGLEKLERPVQTPRNSSTKATVRGHGSLEKAGVRFSLPLHLSSCRKSSAAAHVSELKRRSPKTFPRTRSRLTRQRSKSTELFWHTQHLLLVSCARTPKPLHSCTLLHGLLVLSLRSISIQQCPTLAGGRRLVCSAGSSLVL